MSKTKKMLIAVSSLLLVFSLVSMTRIFLRDYTEQQKIEELTEAEYYLNHDFDKRENTGGLPFLDKDSEADTSNILLIHGHHMKSGWMFKDLMKYKNESFYKEHATFQFSTLYEKEEYEIVAVILSEVYRKSDDVFKYYQIGVINTPAEFDSYVQNIKKLALYDTGVTAHYGDKLVVLSTCEYSTENGRLAVVARKR
ncbi:class B sortase [Paenibacillus illinoisensis]|uniref:Class B sortase n=1 Tax=Paenibacillus illinoisensis TaxID=59845 RepID=A0ABW8I004_9BACL